MERRIGILFLLFLALSSLYVSYSAVQIKFSNATVSLERIAHMAGTSVAIAILPLIWWSLKRFCFSKLKGPLILWATLVSLTIYANQHVREFAAQSIFFEWAVDGCDLSISFPYQYREYETIVHRPPDYLPARIQGAEATTNGLLRAECGLVASSSLIEHMLEESFLTDMMEQIGNDYALSPRTYKIIEFHGRPVAVLFGYRQTERGPIALEISNYIMNNSIFTIYMSHFSDEWPFAEAAEFKNSIRRLE